MRWGKFWDELFVDLFAGSLDLEVVYSTIWGNYTI